MCKPRTIQEDAKLSVESETLVVAQLEAHTLTANNQTDLNDAWKAERPMTGGIKTWNLSLGGMPTVNRDKIFR